MDIGPITAVCLFENELMEDQSMELLCMWNLSTYNYRFVVHNDISQINTIKNLSGNRILVTFDQHLQIWS